MLNYKNNMSCPTCTDTNRCVVDRRCTNRMNMRKCDTALLKNAPVPDFKPPYYETDKNGRPVHPVLTHYVPELHNRVEGFGFLGLNTQTVLVLLLLAAVVYYLMNRQ